METLSDKMNLIHCSACGCNKYECFEKEDVKASIKKIKKLSWCNKCGVGIAFKENMPNCNHEWILKYNAIILEIGDKLV